MDTDINLQRKNFEQLAGAKHYYGWMVDIFRPYLGRRLLEIGCGQGNVTVELLDRERVVGLDFNERYLSSVRKRFSSAPQFEARNRDITKDTQELKLERFDTIVGINVIEHIENDGAALEELYDILEPGGHLILLAPAFPYLFSDFDRKVGHYRRYTKRTLVETFVGAGFLVRKASYFNMLGALGWLVVFKWLRRDVAGEDNISLLELLTPLLQTIEKLVPVLFGLSVIVVGQKLAV